MKLYNKQLNSIEELRREKQQLKAALRQSDKEGLFSVDDILPAKKDKTKAGNDESNGIDIAGIATALLSSLGNKDTLLSVGLPLLKVAGSQLEKGMVKKILKEVGLGYAKWKAIELAFKGVKHLVDKKVQERAKNR
ncbi:hypothetical protein CAP35_15145 [Chitinophagaceae bacterium IBVUCB1]|nr:hypothetical protein CAP35_15145 [Chitinophagaceae bacterium IBVUCB1]